LYAGTEFGMYVSFDDGAHWQPFQQNLPTTPITDIELHRGDMALSTMGRGFWIMDNLTPLRQIDEEVADADAHLYEVPDQHRLRYDAPGAYGGGEPHYPEYPQPGVMIDYYLAEEPAGEVQLEILDQEGNVVRGFSSSADGYRYEQKQGMRDPQMVRVGGEQDVPDGAGMHRFVWNMEYPGPVVPDALSEYLDEGSSYGGPEDDGPLAAPGSYRARLIVGGDTVATRSFELMIDPRVQEDGTTVADLREQHDLNLRIRDAISRAQMMAGRVLRLEERVEDAGGEHGSLLSEIHAL
ncbi:MAG: hypothetical protein ABEJ46_04480, partial [Gemmatimonadota bacterium]